MCECWGILYRAPAVLVIRMCKLKMAQKRDEFLDDLRRTAAIDFKEMAGVACLKKEMNF